MFLSSNRRSGAALDSPAQEQFPRSGDDDHRDQRRTKSSGAEICSYQLIHRKMAALVSTEVDGSGGPRIHESDGREGNGGASGVSDDSQLHDANRAADTHRATRIGHEAHEDAAATRKQEGEGQKLGEHEAHHG